jgi:hypothetical protein
MFLDRELRQTITRLGLIFADWTGHEMHHKAVSLAAKHDRAGKLLHKPLDRRHRLAISQVGKARADVDLTKLWRDAVRRGDIPGAYWAALTHPASTQALVRLVFGEVHMLSHLVGAANRADIRRLTELEQKNAALEVKLRHQQEALREAALTRDASIRDLREALRPKLGEEVPLQTGDEGEALRALVTDLEKPLNAESRRRAALETRFSDLRGELTRERTARGALEVEIEALRSELSAVEAGLVPEAEWAAWRMGNLSLLYVGGRSHQIAHLRSVSEH